MTREQMIDEAVRRVMRDLSRVCPPGVAHLLGTDQARRVFAVSYEFPIHREFRRIAGEQSCPTPARLTCPTG